MEGLGIHEPPRFSIEVNVPWGGWKIVCFIQLFGDVIIFSIVSSRNYVFNVLPIYFVLKITQEDGPPLSPLRSLHWTQRTSSQLYTIVGNIGVNVCQHPCGTLWTPWRVHAPHELSLFWGKGGRFLVHIRTFFSLQMFGMISVHIKIKYCMTESTDQRNSQS